MTKQRFEIAYSVPGLPGLTKDIVLADTIDEVKDYYIQWW